MEERTRVIIRTGVTGIVSNILLALMKALIGVFTHSIAITLDAVNNITDAGSSVITIAGTRLAAKKPDRNHPFGHGRIEYLSAMLIGTIVMAAGISSLVEAIRKILHPDIPDYSPVPLIIVAVCVLVKIFLGRFFTGRGRSVNSEALVNSGKDALMDAVISAATLAAALIFILTGFSVEAWLGAVISLFIIKSGVDMQLQTMSEILGKRVNADYVEAVRKTVEAFPEVHGVYDLMFHDYGPGHMTGSLHIEVDDMMRAYEIHDLLHRITAKVQKEHGLMLTAISIYSTNVGNKKAEKIRNDVQKIADGYKHVLQMHGLYLKENDLHFDLIIDFAEPDPEKLRDEIAGKVNELYPELNVHADWEADYSVSV